MTSAGKRVAPVLRVVALVELAVAAGVVAFWVIFFTRPPPPFADPERAQDYAAFESAFPLADALLAVALATGAAGLMGRARFGPPLSLAAAGALMFLGLLDLSFNLRHRVYTLLPLELGVNLVCVAAGAWVAVTVWRHRARWR